MSEQVIASTEGTQVTPEASSVETQQAAPQASEQEDTTQKETKVTSEMGITAKEESETSSEAVPTIDDIVNEALSGELSEETKKLIEDNGLGRHIDMLVEGHKAIQEKNNQEIYSAVGGKESYKELQEWGATALSKKEQESFNKALFSGDMDLAKLAVEGLKARYVSKNGKAPDRVIEGGGSANTDNRPYSNVNDYLRETQTLKYKQDRDYRAQVETRRNKSGF